MDAATHHATQDRPRRATPALRVQSVGSPTQADLRPLVALLLRLDSRPPLTLVTPKAP